MLSYVLRRVAFSIIPFFGATLIGFVLFRVMPGDPAVLMVGVGSSQAQIQQMRAYLGENLPIYQQYFVWLHQIFTGNLGNSIFYAQPVSRVILSRLPATLELVLTATIIALLVGVGIGVLSALREGSKYDVTARSFSYVAFGIPDFIWGLLFILIFGSYLRIFPVSGRIDPFISFHSITGFFLPDSLIEGDIPALISVLDHLILPSLALALALMAIIQRTIRSSLAEVMQEDYIVTDRMKGLSETYVIYVRALKNSLIPTITILGVQFTFLMGGSILIEYIFGWPGLGSLILNAIQYKDFPLMQGIVVLYAVVVILVNLVVDLLYSFLNPKIRYAR